MTKSDSDKSTSNNQGSHHADTWKSFDLEAGYFLLHVPTSHILSINKQIHDHVQKTALNEDAAEKLSDLVKTLPEAPIRELPKIDIQSIALNVEQNCNLRCSYCYAGDGDYGKNSTLTLEIAKKVLTFFAKGKERFHVSFFGGEPLLQFTLIESIVAWAQEQTNTKFTFAITTNGTLLNDQHMAFIKKNNITLTISHDGKGIQAKQRLNKDKKSNAEALVDRKIKKFEKELGELKSFKLRSTIARENVSLFESSLFDTLNSKNYRISFSRVASDEIDKIFTWDDINQLTDALVHTVDKLIAQKAYDKLLNLGNIRDFVFQLDQGLVNRMACGAGISYLSVSTTGEFYLCHRFTEDESESVGNIETGLDTDKLNLYQEYRQNKHEPCSECWMRNWCAGGCFHENKVTNQTSFKPDPAFCKIQDVEITQAMRIYTLIKNEASHLLGS